MISNVTSQRMLRVHLAGILSQIQQHAILSGVKVEVSEYFPYAEIEIIVPLSEEHPIYYGLEVIHRNGDRLELEIQAPRGECYRDKEALEHIKKMMTALGASHPYLIQHLTELA